MATTKSPKRQFDAVDNTSPAKKVKTSGSTRAKKPCTICAAEVAAFESSPASCHNSHDHDSQRACGECWEAYLSMAVEEHQAEDITCMFCSSLLPEKEVKRLAKDQTGERYDCVSGHPDKH